MNLCTFLSSRLANAALGRAVLLACSTLALASCGGGGSGSSSDFIYAAVGASDAVGIGASPLENGYVFRIADAIEARGTEVELVNTGIPGAEADELEEIAVPAVTELSEPDLITIWTGNNDLVGGVTPEGFEEHLAEILTDLRTETAAVIIIANIPDLTQLPRFTEEPDEDVTPERIAAYNAAIERQAAQVGVPVVDLFSQPIEDFQVSSDGFHPSDAGHQRIADLFLQIALPALGL